MKNGYIASFNGKLRDECLDRERLDTLLEAQALVERSRLEYSQLRLHGGLGYRPSAPEAIAPRSIGQRQISGRTPKAKLGLPS